MATGGTARKTPLRTIGHVTGPGPPFAGGLVGASAVACSTFEGTSTAAPSPVLIGIRAQPQRILELSVEFEDLNNVPRCASIAILKIAGDHKQRPFDFFVSEIQQILRREMYGGRFASGKIDIAAGQDVFANDGSIVIDQAQVGTHAFEGQLAMDVFVFAAEVRLNQCRIAVRAARSDHEQHGSNVVITRPQYLARKFDLLFRNRTVVDTLRAISNAVDVHVLLRLI